MNGVGDRLELAGICLGLAGEAEAVVDHLAETRPAVLALGVAPELVDELHLLEPDDHLGGEDAAYVRGLSRWGDVALPGPEFPEATARAREMGVRVVGIDLGEIDYLDLYSDTISYGRMLRRSFKLRRLVRRPPRAADPHAFCRAFDRTLNHGPYAQLEQRRERTMAERLGELVAAGPVLAVVEVQRLDGIREELQRTWAGARAR